MSLSFLCYYYTYFACSFKFICISVPHTEIIIVKESLILQGVLIKKGKQIISKHCVPWPQKNIMSPN